MAQKQADIRYRVQLKQRPHIVIYKVRSGDDSEDYTVTVIHGRVNSCSCISRKPCYHMVGVEAAENARRASEQERRETASLNGNHSFSLMR